VALKIFVIFRRTAMTQQLMKELQDELEALVDQVESDLDGMSTDRLSLIEAIQSRISEKAEEIRARENDVTDHIARRSEDGVKARAAIQDRIVKLEGLAVKMQSAIRRLAAQYNELVSLEAQIYELGQIASDWKFESFKHLRFGEATYSFLVHALSAELRLQKQPIHGWPSLNKACEKSEPGVAFYDYIVERIRFDSKNCC